LFKPVGASGTAYANNDTSLTGKDTFFDTTDTARVLIVLGVVTPGVTVMASLAMKQKTHQYKLFYY